MVLIIVCIIAGLGAGIGTGLAGLSAAVVITPMLITFCGFTAYEAVGIALASDVLASAVTASPFQCSLGRQFLCYDIYYGRSVSCKPDHKDNIKDG